MILGLVGLKGSGKSTLASFLTRNHGPTAEVLAVAERLADRGFKPLGELPGGEEYTTWRDIAFAGALKRACQIIFGFDDGQLEDPVRKEAVDPAWGFSPRFAFQQIGTEVCRHVHPEVWLKAAKRAADPLIRSGRSVVVTDCRFVNEAAALREWGAEYDTPVRVVRIVRRVEGAAVVRDVHASEVEQLDIDCDGEILNAGTRIDLGVHAWEYIAEVAKRAS